MNLVLDCSYMMSILLPDERPPLFIDFSVYTIYVPSVFMLECINALIVAEKRGRMTRDERNNATEELLKSPLVIASTSPGHLLETARLATEQGLTSYEASYLELAMRMDAKLATFDKELAQAGQSLGISVLH